MEVIFVDAAFATCALCPCDGKERQTRVGWGGRACEGGFERDAEWSSLRSRPVPLVPYDGEERAAKGDEKKKRRIRRSRPRQHVCARAMLVKACGNSAKRNTTDSARASLTKEQKKATDKKRRRKRTLTVRAGVAKFDNKNETTTDSTMVTHSSTNVARRTSLSEWEAG